MAQQPVPRPNKNIKVGVFGDLPKVPAPMRGATIYFSPKLDKFAIVDVNGKTLNFFDFEKYKQFESIDVIQYNRNMKEYLDACYEELQMPVFDDAFDDDFEDDLIDELDEFGNYDSESLSPLEGYSQPSVRPVSQMSVQEDEPVSTHQIKDPTRHLFSFYLTVFILAAVVVIIVLFGLPIINQLQTLIS